jgi:hypothetical protein
LRKGTHHGPFGMDKKGELAEGRMTMLIATHDPGRL